MRQPGHASDHRRTPRHRMRGGRGARMAVSRFFCFPIQMNFAERQKVTTSGGWRGRHHKVPAGYMNGGGPKQRTARPREQSRGSATPPIHQYHLLKAPAAWNTPLARRERPHGSVASPRCFHSLCQPPRSRPLRWYGVLGMPDGAAGFAPRRAVGWALWVTGRWLDMRGATGGNHARPTSSND